MTRHGTAQATGANYHRLIACVVKGLDRSTAEAREVVYERARTALTAHLRLNQAGLSQADVVKERLALEEAIRKIEAEAARESRTEIMVRYSDRLHQRLRAILAMEKGPQGDRTFAEAFAAWERNNRESPGTAPRALWVR